MLLQPFLTDLDSRAAIKGSRDPLGVQQIWTHFGRYVVGNLTTVSTSLRDFTTLLLGYYFVERIADEGGGEGDLATFLKWEQFAGYARAAINDDLVFRGTERVQKNLSEGSRIRLSADAAGQILGNQKIYGLWGLYTVAARSSGFVEGDPARLTPDARRLVEQVYLPSFAKSGFRNADAIVACLKERQIVLDIRNRDRAMIEAVAKVLQRRVLSSERAAYRDHLVLGGPQDRTAGLQRLLATLLEPTLDEPKWSLSAPRIRQLAKTAKAHGENGERLAEYLEYIRTCELLLAPSVALFDFVLGSDGQNLQEVAKKIGTHWDALATIDVSSVANIEAHVGTAVRDTDATARWMGLARAFASGHYEKALRILIEHNSAVMMARSGAAPWVSLRDGCLQVEFQEEDPSPLPEREELHDFWRNPYFIDSVRTMVAQVRE